MLALRLKVWENAGDAKMTMKRGKIIRLFISLILKWFKNSGHRI
jgi:hypothetical protein